MSKRKVIRRHFWQTTNLFVENAVSNNIVLFQALGLCPVIAAGVTLQSGVALTVCSAAVLLPLSFVIALVGNHLPKWLRPALYVVLASLLLVGMAFLLGQYISPELYARLYLFIPLMAVNSQMVLGLRTMCSTTDEPKAVVKTMFCTKAMVTKKDNRSPMFSAMPLIISLISAPPPSYGSRRQYAGDSIAAMPT